MLPMPEDIDMDVWLDMVIACAGLTLRQREVMALTLLGYTQAEIARQRGVSQQAVCRMLRRAIIRLRSLMDRGL